MVKPAKRPQTPREMLDLMRRTKNQAYWIDDLFALPVTLYRRGEPTIADVFSSVAVQELRRHLGWDTIQLNYIGENEWIEIYTDQYTPEDGEEEGPTAEVCFDLSEWPTVKWNTLILTMSGEIVAVADTWRILDTDFKTFEPVADQHKVDWDFWLTNYIEYNHG